MNHADQAPGPAMLLVLALVLGLPFLLLGMLLGFALGRWWT